MNKILKMLLNFYGTILSPNITNEPPHDKTNITTCAAYVDSKKEDFEPPHDKTNKMTFVPSEDSDQPGFG